MTMKDITWDEYISFINEPKHMVNPIRDIILFDNPFLEILTKAPWYAIPIGWAPVIFYFWV